MRKAPAIGAGRESAGRQDGQKGPRPGMSLAGPTSQMVSSPGVLDVAATVNVAVDPVSQDAVRITVSVIVAAGVQVTDWETAMFLLAVARLATTTDRRARMLPLLLPRRRRR